MAIAQMGPDRPPFIQFHEMSVEDRNATIEKGHLVLKPQHMVTVRQIGSKDGPEFIAEDWIKQQETLAANGRLNPDWVKNYRAQFEAWKAGMDGPVNGFPIREWPGVNRAMAENMIAVDIMAVEDLASANEETLQRIGIGARGLQQKARAWLETKSGGVNPEEVAALRSQLEDRDARIKSLEDRFAALEAKKAK